MNAWLAIIFFCSLAVTLPTAFPESPGSVSDPKTFLSFLDNICGANIGSSTTYNDCLAEAKRETERAEILLDSLSKSLMFYVRQAPFDTKAFENQAQKIQNGLRSIDAKSLFNVSEGFIKKYDFARQVFQVLVDSATYLRRYNDPGDPSRVCLKQIIEIHRCALSLHNMYGEIDVENLGFAMDIWVLQDFVKSLTSTVCKSRKSFTMLRIFKSEVDQVERALFLLDLQIPRT